MTKEKFAIEFIDKLERLKLILVDESADKANFQSQMSRQGSYTSNFQTRGHHNQESEITQKAFNLQEHFSQNIMTMLT